MKKIKILIPAIAAIALTGAATITGTVAWFTVTRATTAYINKISVTNPDTNLDIDFRVKGDKPASMIPTGGAIGTTDNNNDTLNLSAKLWNSTIDLTKATPTIGFANGPASTDAYQACPASLVRTGNVFYAYRAVFTVGTSEGTATDEYGVLFDTSKVMTGATGWATETGASTNARTALRIGLVAGANYWVIAPFNSDSLGTGIPYGEDTGVPGAAPGVKRYKADHAYNATSALGTKLTDGTAKGTTAGEFGYLGDIKGQSDSAYLYANALDVTMYIWFDGMDPNCNNGEVDATTNYEWKAALPIYAIKY